MKTSKSEKVKSVATTAVSEGDGNPGLTIAAIKRLLEAIGSEAYVNLQKRLTSPLPNHAECRQHGCSCMQLAVAGDSPRSLQEAPQQGFMMGMTKSMEDIR